MMRHTFQATIFCFVLVVTCLLQAAQPGAIAVFEDEATAGSGADIPTTGYVHDFSTTVHADTGYTLSGGTDVQLDAGHYLVLYNSFFNDTGGPTRSEMQSNLNLAGSNLSTGWSQAYIRRATGQDEAITSGAGIINVASSGDALQLQSFLSDANTATVERLGTGLQLLKLNDSWDFLSVSRTIETSNVGLSGTVTYDSITEATAGFGYAANGTDVTLNEGGKYLVVANTFFNTDTSSTRSTYVQELSLDDVTISGTQSSVYIRGNAASDGANDGAAAIATIIDATAGQSLSVDFFADTNSYTNADIVADQTALNVVKLPDTAQYLIASADAGQDVNDTNALTWTGSQIDAAFTLAPNSSTVTVNEDGDYLFLYSVFTDDGSNTDRIYPEIEVVVDGLPKIYGQSGFNVRDDNGGGDIGGKFGGILLTDLLAGSEVEFFTNPLSDNLGTLTLDSGRLQGVFLPSLAVGVPEPTSIAIWSLVGLGLAGFGYRRARRNK